MSRARRLDGSAGVAPVTWMDLPGTATAGMDAPAAPPSSQDADGADAALEHEAYARGYAQGERAAGQAAAREVGEARARFAAAVVELGQARLQVVRDAERDMVKLALAVARRLIAREVSLDHTLVAAMARVALDRLQDADRLTVVVHPDDHEAVVAAQARDLAGAPITVVADARVGPGGCRVESEHGFVEAGVDAQLGEIARALLGDDERSRQ